MRYFVIPARKGSKGFPFKNRKLLKFTLKIFPNEYHKDIIITTDDEHIIDQVKNTEITIVRRDEELSNDNASIKPVLIDVIHKCGLNDDDDLILLYLTYPQRTIEKIEEIYKFYEQNSGVSLLCAKKVKTHPYLCFYKRNNYKGEPIVRHNLYRRQDYPECFRLSFYVCIVKAGYIENLNFNLYNDETIFYDIEDYIDIDSPDDFERFLEENK
ncbi:MAG: cytidylyltransferase domain-containing protein [Promethearchaeota archaeon]